MRISLKLYQQLILTAIVLGLILVAMRWLEIRFILLNNQFEIYAGIISLVFTALGIWLALRLSKPRIEVQILEREINTIEADFIFNQSAFEAFCLSKRELEVLQKMAKGLSNQEIADELFVSLNTIKTHISKLFEKLDVKRRTQAVELARKLALID